jgi:hypothetical protein
MPKVNIEDLFAELDFPSPMERRRGNRRRTDRRNAKTNVASEMRQGERRRNKRRREDRDLDLVRPDWLERGDS